MTRDATRPDRLSLPLAGQGASAPASFSPLATRHSPLATRHSPLVDSFGRVHNNLRISVTDRCNLRCVYCMPEDVVFLDKGELLSFEEITHFVRVAAPLGIDKVRLTGGEPLMRRDLPHLVRMLAGVPVNPWLSTTPTSPPSAANGSASCARIT